MWLTFRVASMRPWVWAVAARRPSMVGMGFGEPILPQVRAMGRVTGRMRLSNWVDRFESQRRRRVADFGSRLRMRSMPRSISPTTRGCP